MASNVLSNHYVNIDSSLVSPGWLLDIFSKESLHDFTSRNHRT